jgi:hypothetical protein
MYQDCGDDSTLMGLLETISNSEPDHLHLAPELTILALVRIAAVRRFPVQLGVSTFLSERLN